MIKINIGNNIKSVRKQKGFTQKELALKANISRSYLADIENNRYNPSIDTIKHIAEALKYPFSFLIDPPIKAGKEAITYLEQNSKTESKLREEAEIYDSINKDMSNIINIPIVGVVRAGTPILAQDNISGYLPTLKEFLDSDKDYFYLKVKGDSMNQEFKEGSLLLIEKTPCVENGQIGVVLIDGMEATVKKIVKNENMITLIPMSNNPEYVPKMYDIKKDEIQIIGAVKQAIKIY